MNAVALGIARLGVAAIGMTIILATKRKLSRAAFPPWPSRQWVVLATIGVCFGLHWLFYFLSIKTANASLGALSFSTYGIQLVALGWLLRLTKVHTWDVGGIVLAMAGAVLIIPRLDFDSDKTIGVLYGILSGTWYAFLPVLHQRNSQIDVDLRTWAQFTFAWPVFLVFFSQSEWHGGRSDWLILLYLSVVVTLLGHALWVHATTALSTTTTSVLSYLYVPMAMVSGWLLLDEEITGRMTFGATCIIAGNAITLWSQARRKALLA